jgi:hypothetical protein
MSMQPEDVAMRELLQRELALGVESARRLSDLHQQRSATRYSVEHREWQAVNRELESVRYELRSKMNENGRSLLAIAVIELLRPVFSRWATEQTFSFYKSLMEQLWHYTGLESHSWPPILATIEQLPEFGCEDSCERDFVVANSLDLVRCALPVIGPGTPELSGAEVPEFETAAQQFVDELEEELSGVHFSPTLNELRRLIIEAKCDLRSSMAKLKGRAVQLSEKTNAALEAMARANHWSLDREGGPIVIEVRPKND